MRKLLWISAITVLAAGAYWSVAHGTVHPGSPVGRALVWLGVNKSLPTQMASIVEPCTSMPGCNTESEQTIYVQAHKPAGLIVIQPDFVPMPDAEGNEAYSQVVVRTEPIREVVPSEDFRIMPEVEEAVPAPKEKGQLSIGLSLSATTPCPIDLVCEVKCGDVCKMMSFSGLYAFLHGQSKGECCPAAQACQKALTKACCPDCPVACCKEGCKNCPAGCKECPVGKVVQPERIQELPVEVEESEPARKPMSEIPSYFRKPTHPTRTMEMRPTDVGALPVPVID